MKSITSVKILFITGLIIKTDIWAFRCNNGNEILDFQFCNRYDDCGDSSDEKYGCNRRSCGRGKFTCNNRSCMDISVRCNGILDCSDQSDEQNCAEHTRIEVQPENCPLQQGKFLCRNKLACLDFSLVCDGQCHCIDCSDENTQNCAKLDSESCSSCTQYCLPTPDGPQCICDSSSYESSSLCKEIQNCTQGSACDQHCIRYRNFERCLCYEGHHEVYGSNGQKCRSNMWLEAVLMYSTVTRIKFFHLYKNTTEIFQNGVYCTALTSADHYTYYASLRNNKGYIYKSLITEPGVVEEIVELDSRVTSLSIDWITNNVYFTNGKSLSVCANNQSEVCTRLKCCGINNVVLTPKFGRMFYMEDTMTGENDQFLKKSNMDGSEEEMLLPDESFLNPVSLTVDEHTETLFWLEIADQKILHSVSLDGSNKKIHSFVTEGFSSFVAVNNEFYFAKKHNNLILYSGSLSHAAERFEDSATNSIGHLHFYLPGFQRSSRIENPCAEAGCTSLCLIRPSSSSNGLSYRCLCENFTPNDDKWCNQDEEYAVQHKGSLATEVVDSTTEYSTTDQSQSTTNQEQTHPSSTSTETANTSENYSTTENHTTTDQFQTTTSGEFSSSSGSTTSDEISSSTTLSENQNTASSIEPSTTTSETCLSTEQVEIVASSSSQSTMTSAPHRFDYVLIYSTVTKIKAWYLSTHQHEVIQDKVDCTALAGVGENIYYATLSENNGGIFKISTDSARTRQSPLQIVQMDSQVTSIAVDRITNNVYFTTNMSLSVCSSTGEICAKLKCCDTDAVALAPSFRLMFYTHKLISDEKRLIMKSGMDGSEEQILLDEGFYQLGSLTVDEWNQRLYWIETEEQILHSVSFSGGGKKSESLKNSIYSYKYFAILESSYFFTTEQNGFKWQSPHSYSVFEDDSTNSVKFLHAYKASLQNNNTIQNPCEFSPCQKGLCILRPESPRFSCISKHFIPNNENRFSNNKRVFGVLKNDFQESNETSLNLTSKKVQNSTNVSTGSAPAPFVVSVQNEYLNVSGIMGFLLGISAASCVISACLVFKKSHNGRERRKLKINDEMEL